MKYALCVKLCQHDFTIVIVHKLLVHGHCLESGLNSLSVQKLSMSTPSRSCNYVLTARLVVHCLREQLLAFLSSFITPS